LCATLAAAVLLPPRILRPPARPTPEGAERRLERDSGLPHRPFAVLRDAPAAPDAAHRALWQLHTNRAAAALHTLRLRAPHANLAPHDPNALRFAAVLLLLAGLVTAGPQAPQRILQAFLPSFGDGAAPAPVLQAWLEPPAYTGLPPVFLPKDGGSVQIPQGAKLTVSLTGGRLTPHLSAPDGTLKFATLGAASWQATGRVEHSGDLTLSRLFGTVARWHLDVLANTMPVANFTGAPGRAGRSLETKLPWHTAQRWGVASLTATLRPAGHADLPPIVLPIPLPGTPKDASGTLLSDLSANPYAGIDMDAVLTARDVSGQQADGDPARFTLPARDFKNGLARAIIQVRRRLALQQETTDEAAADIDALALTPKEFAGHAAIYLNTVAVAALLRASPGRDGVAEAQRRLWIVALALDGALPEMTQQALDEAVQSLKRALAEHKAGKLSAGELSRQIEKLREALAQRLNDMARRAVRDGKLPQFDPQAQHFAAPSIDRMIQAMEKAAREGRTDDAEKRMAELEKLLSQLDHARVLSPAEARQAEQAQKEASKQSGAVQDLVQREAGLMDRAQQRAPRAAPLDPRLLEQQLQQYSRGLPPPPDTDQLEAQEEQRGADATTQRALHQALQALQNALHAAGAPPPAAFNAAGHDMQNATDALSAGREDAARVAEAKTIEDLRRGGQDLARQRSANPQMVVVPGAPQSQQEGEEGTEPGGEDGSERDPLGRPRQQGTGGRAADDNSVHVPTEMEQLRSRAIQEELRRRGANRQRPHEELDYIERLLKPF
jgi:uncharacterized protein (TIGR02302 family)